MNELVIRWALEYDDGLQFVRRSIHNHTTNSNRFTTMYFRRTCKWQILVTVVIIPIGLIEKLEHLDQSRNTVHGCCKQGGWGAPPLSFCQNSLQPGADYAHHSTTCPSRFSDLATALQCVEKILCKLKADVREFLTFLNTIPAWALYQVCNILFFSLPSQ